MTKSKETVSLEDAYALLEVNKENTQKEIDAAFNKTQRDIQEKYRGAGDILKIVESGREARVFKNARDAIYKARGFEKPQQLSAAIGLPTKAVEPTKPARIPTEQEISDAYNTLAVNKTDSKEDIEKKYSDTLKMLPKDTSQLKGNIEKTLILKEAYEAIVYDKQPKQQAKEAAVRPRFPVASMIKRFVLNGFSFRASAPNIKLNSQKDRGGR